MPKKDIFLSDGLTWEEQQEVYNDLSDREQDILRHYTSEYETREEKHMEFWDFFRHWALWYPDLFYEMVSEMAGTNFKFDPDQKMIIREMSRRQSTTIINNRRWGKSFLAVAVELLKCIIIPYRNTAFSVRHKDDAMDILSEKIDELIRFFPFIEEEKSKLLNSNDGVSIEFPNGSKLYATTALKSRGKTITGAVIIDEWCFRDLDEVDNSMTAALTTRTNVKTGRHDPVDFNNIHKISSAGYYNSRAHNEYKDAFKNYAKTSEEFVSTTSYSHNLLFNRSLDIGTLEAIKDKSLPIYFDMNYRSIFGGSGKAGSIPIDQIERARKIAHPEIKRSSAKSVEYFVSVDFARSDRPQGDRGIITVGKVWVDNSGRPYKLDIPAIIDLPKDMTAEEQILRVKRVDEIFQPLYHVWDANGAMGQLFIDEAMKVHTDDKGNVYPAFKRINGHLDRDTESSNFKSHVWGIQTGGNVQTEVLNAFQLLFAQKKVNILKSYKTKLNDISSKDMFLTKQLSHYLTDLFIDECLNTQIVTNSAGKSKIQYISNSRRSTKDVLMTFAYLIYFVFKVYPAEYMDGNTEEEDTSAYTGLFHRA